MILRVGRLAAPVLVGPSASHSSSGKTSPSHRPGSTTMPSGIRATRASSAATAGAAVVMPAATVKPGRRIVLPPFGQAAKQRCCAARRGRSRPRRARCAGQSSIDQLRASGAISPNAPPDRWSPPTASASRAGRPSRPARHRASAPGRRRAATLRARPSPANDSTPASAAARVGSIAGGTGSPIVDRIERAADRVPRARDRRRESAAAAADRPRSPGRTLRSPSARRGCWAAGYGRGPAPGGRRQTLDQARGQRVGERSVRRDGEDRGPDRRDRLRHARSPLPSSGSTGACRHRTTGPGGPRRSSALPRSRGPTGYWSRTVPWARRAAAAWRRSGCR